MAARLQRDIGGGAASSLTGIGKRLGFGMGTAAGLCPTPADDDTVLDDDTADSGIRPDIAEAAAPEGQCGLHETAVGHGVGHGQSISTRSPSRNSLKSAASRKLR